MCVASKKGDTHTHTIYFPATSFDSFIFTVTIRKLQVWQSSYGGGGSVVVLLCSCALSWLKVVTAGFYKWQAASYRLNALLPQGVSREDDSHHRFTRL